MKHITFYTALLLTTIGFSQTNYQIDAQAMAWSPNDINIIVGDSVTWINANNGSHNLNGSTTTYPTNPESFEMLTISSTWTFGKKFTLPGTYLYRCNVHSGTMTGKVIVANPSSSIEEKEITFNVYPNPAKDFVQIKTSATEYSVQLFDMLGNRVLTQNMNGKYTIDISSLPQGMYMMEINAGSNHSTRRLIKK